MSTPRALGNGSKKFRTISDPPLVHLGLKMSLSPVPHIYLCSTRTSGGYFRPSKDSAVSYQVSVFMSNLVTTEKSHWFGTDIDPGYFAQKGLNISFMAKNMQCCIWCLPKRYLPIWWKIPFRVLVTGTSCIGNNVDYWYCQQMDRFILIICWVNW